MRAIIGKAIMTLTFRRSGKNLRRKSIFLNECEMRKVTTRKKKKNK